jgi:hypothetical protein
VKEGPYPGDSPSQSLFALPVAITTKTIVEELNLIEMGSTNARSLRSGRSNVAENFTTPQKVVSYSLTKTPTAGQTPQNPVNLGAETYTSPSMKRKADELPSEDVSCETKNEKKVKKQKIEKEEKRVRRFRPHPPQSFREIYDRALSQRFYVLNRVRGGTQDCPEEDVEMTGSTGNIYNVHVGKQPRCTCPHNEKGHQCKHILYVSFLRFLSRISH